MKKLRLPLLLLVCALAFGANEILAQPPSLPSAPSQAPIDGGLGILAIAGGTYAWKKFKSNKQVD